MEVNDLHSFLHFVRFPELDALRKVRDSNPRYDVMRTPHFECGSFDHSDNFPCDTEPFPFKNDRKSTAFFLTLQIKNAFFLFFYTLRTLNSQPQYC